MRTLPFSNRLIRSAAITLGVAAVLSFIVGRIMSVETLMWDPVHATYFYADSVSPLGADLVAGLLFVAALSLLAVLLSRRAKAAAHR